MGVDKGQALSDYYVYALYRDAAMGNPFYIGKGRRQRINQHAVIVAKDKSHRANTIRQVVKELGFLPRQKIAEGMTEENAFRLEIELIKQFGIWPNGRLINRTPGGDQLDSIGRQWTAEERAKVSATMKGRKKDPQHAAKVAAALRGIKRSPETRELLRVVHIGQKPWNKGVTHTPATRLKLSIAHTGKKYGKRPPEVGLKMSRLIWITDGISSHRISKELAIPDGWYRGRKILR